MSYEGYTQALCANGHEQTVQQYDDRATCDLCSAKIVWRHEVDVTNGCYCDGPSDPLKCSAHRLVLEVDRPATFKSCPSCDHKKMLTQTTYKIPGTDHR